MPAGVYSPNNKVNVDKIRRDGPFPTIQDCRSFLSNTGIKNLIFVCLQIEI